jgi:uncharacterized protein with FMN-binding domain
MKKIALSVFVVAASGAYVLAQSGAQPSDDISGPVAQVDEASTGGIAGRDANVRDLQAAAANQPALSQSAALPRTGEEGSSRSGAALTETDEEAATLPPAPTLSGPEPPPPQAGEEGNSRAGLLVASTDTDEEENLPPPQAASVPRAQQASIVGPVGTGVATNLLPASPSQRAPAPESPALAVLDVPLPRPRPEYRLTRASATRVAMTVSAVAGLTDGTYTGPTVDAYYGEVQVQAIVQGGRLTAIKVLRYPSDRRTSLYINRQALPRLRDEVIRAQSAHVDIVSGATLTSRAFIRSLDAALKQANA